MTEPHEIPESVVAYLQESGFAVIDAESSRRVAVERGGSERVIVIQAEQGGQLITLRSVHPDLGTTLTLQWAAEPDLEELLRRFLQDAAGRAAAPDLTREIALQARALEERGWTLVGWYSHVYQGAIVLRRADLGLVVSLDWLELRGRAALADWPQAVAKLGAVTPLRDLTTEMPLLSAVTTPRTVREHMGSYFRHLSEELAELGLT